MDQHDLNQYWKTVVDTIQDGVMIVSPEGTIVSVNRAFEEITRYQREEIVGQSCAILNCTSCEIIRGKGSCQWCAMFEKGRLRRQKCLLIRKNGSPVSVVKNASVLKDSGGNVTGAVETMTDITDLVDKETQIATFRKELDAEDRFYGMIGLSAQMQQVFELITNAAQSDAPVIIYGESGTGKELVAKAIHEASRRLTKPYIKVNCAALNESLLESELFGHVKGAYTGAHRDREGRFELAHGGDIFLDEIGDLPLSTQVKLLRVLEEKVVERVGDHRPIEINTRIISATNRDLTQLIAKGRFREDFYYRINVIPIHVPPLRERADDIPLLASYFCQNFAAENGKPLMTITDRAMQGLMAMDWPGNVRQLQNVLERAVILSTDDILDVEILGLSDEMDGDREKPQVNSEMTLRDMERELILRKLETTRGNRTVAAHQLGISVRTLRNKLNLYTDQGVEIPG